MKDMLFLSQRIPFPPNKGDKIRSFNILKHFAKTHKIHLGCFIDDPEDWAYIDDLKEICADVFTAPLNQTWGKIRSLKAFFNNDPLNLPYFYNRSLEEWCVQVLDTVKPDVAFAFSSQMAQYFMAPSRRPRRVVVDYCDVDSDKWLQYAKSKTWPMNWVFNREGRTLLEFDRRVGEFIDYGTFVADPEVELFRRLAPESAEKIHSISNGIDGEYFSPDREYENLYPDSSPVLLFTGAMDYWPNVDAAVWFAQEIFPLVKAKAPDVQFYVVGGNPTADVLHLDRIDGVHVTGRVPDMRPYFAHADVSVVPMRIARGIQNKVLEAMAMAKPTVTTQHSLDGIDAMPDKDLLLANEVEEFVECVLRCLSDPETKLLGKNARNVIVESYTWPARLGGFDALLS
jgi:sugar transferase (PEP-CTERM/EpsH1 system associated)